MAVLAFVVLVQCAAVVYVLHPVQQVAVSHLKFKWYN